MTHANVGHGAPAHPVLGGLGRWLRVFLRESMRSGSRLDEIRAILTPGHEVSKKDKIDTVLGDLRRCPEDIKHVRRLLAYEDESVRKNALEVFGQVLAKGMRTSLSEFELANCLEHKISEPHETDEIRERSAYFLARYYVMNGELDKVRVLLSKDAAVVKGAEAALEEMKSDGMDISPVGPEILRRSA